MNVIFYKSIFLLCSPVKKKSERSWGFHPPPLRLPPNAIPPEQGIRQHRIKRRGGKGGQELPPSLVLPQGNPMVWIKLGSILTSFFIHS
jgi:hypothetical protein